MIWHFVIMAAISAGSYFGPCSDAIARVEQMMIDMENLREEWRQVNVVPFQARGGVGPACNGELGKLHDRYVWSGPRIDSDDHFGMDSEWCRYWLTDPNRIQGGRTPRGARSTLHHQWMNDQPSHLTPYRIDGGVGPASSSI